MLTVPRHLLAENLAAYGETEASARIASMSDIDYRRVCEIGFEHAVKGTHLLKSACLAAIEVIEGKARELKRKSRRWGDVQRLPQPADPIHEEVLSRFRRYAGGNAVKKADVLSHLIRVVGANLKGFTYFKSHAEFRSRFPDGVSFVGLHRGHSTVSLTFGVRHERLEKTLADLFPDVESKTFHWKATIWKSSYNMGPSSPHWTYPTETTWPILGSEGLALATPEIIAFLKEAAEPYALRHQEPLAIRNTLMFLPGHADVPSPDVITIFAVDYLARRRDLLDQDFEQLSERYATRPAQSEPTSPPIPSSSSVGIVFMMGAVKKTDSVPWAERLKRTYDHVVDKWDSER